MKLLRTAKRISKNENVENVPLLEVTEVLHYFQQRLSTRFLYRFVPTRSFGELFDISSKDFISLRTFNS